MNKTLHAILALLCALVASNSQGAPPQEFLGKWYSKPVNGGDMYRRDLFNRVEILADGSFVLTRFLIDDESSEKTIIEAASKGGVCTVEDQRLICVYTGLGKEFGFALKASADGSLIMSKVDSDGASTAYLRESEAPWSKYKVGTVSKTQ